VNPLSYRLLFLPVDYDHLQPDEDETENDGDDEDSLNEHLVPLWFGGEEFPSPVGVGQT
jgi:hypothetical protein